MGKKQQSDQRRWDAVHQQGKRDGDRGFDHSDDGQPATATQATVGGVFGSVTGRWHGWVRSEKSSFWSWDGGGARGIGFFPKNLFSFKGLEIVVMG